uniref:Uncharacterized protein n=1 Tax=Avena sativa TaxID=4498 RepID=A0ACD5W9Y6_AVESA
MKTNSDDLAYLRRFAAATGADKALGWRIGSDPCEDGWSGVECGDAGKVAVINIQDKGLFGTLRVLRLDGNAFTNMPEKFFGGMPGILGFNISNNTALAGWTLSEELHSLTQLRSFQASHAGINGTLYRFFSNGTNGFPFPSLDKVSLAFNHLSGHVPEIKGSTISELDLSNNMLSGSISFISDVASSMEQLRLSHNHFTGPMPEFTDFKGLYFLYVDHNHISGVVPASLTQLSSIMVVYLSGNFLQGPVPEFDSSVHTDVAKAATRGNFCRLDRGPCDPEVESLLLIARAFGYPSSFATSWQRNDACAGWIGVHCDDHRRVTGINLSRIGLNGTMDSAFGSLQSLEAILLSGNNIFGEIPESVVQLPSLRIIDVSNNNLVGTVPKFRDDIAVWAEGNPRLKLSGSSLSTPSTACFFSLIIGRIEFNTAYVRVEQTQPRQLQSKKCIRDNTSVPSTEKGIRAQK